MSVKNLLCAGVTLVTVGALGIVGTGTASAAEVISSKDSHLAVEGYLSSTHSDLPEASKSLPKSMTQEERLAEELEILFAEYLSQDESGTWFITEAGFSSQVPIESLKQIANALNYRAAQKEGNAIMKPMVSDYTKCVIDASGLGAIAGLFTGAFSTLIEKQLWEEAAMYIVKLVGKNAFKGGVVGLAAFLAASAIWCTTPWSK